MRLLSSRWLLAAMLCFLTLHIGCSGGCSKEKPPEGAVNEAKQPEKVADPIAEGETDDPEAETATKSVRDRKLQKIADKEAENADPATDEKRPTRSRNEVSDTRRTGRGPADRIRNREVAAVIDANAPEIAAPAPKNAVPSDPAALANDAPVVDPPTPTPTSDLAAQQALLAEASAGKTNPEQPTVPASRAERLAALQKDLNDGSIRRPEPSIVDVPGPDIVEPVPSSRTIPSIDQQERARETTIPSGIPGPHQTARTGQASVPIGPPIPIDHALALAELQSISGKQFKIDTLSGQLASPSYNSLYFSPKIGQDFGVAVQLWHESSIRDTRTRYEQMKASYPNVQETGNVTTYTYFAHWKDIYYLVFMDLKKRRVVCVSGSNKALSPNQLFTLATKVRDRLI